jgi:RimJ/RimL family protein N-acetyltransferase/glycosyltransferase involved in cell wall biosynthesis
MHKVLIRPLQIEDASISWKWRNDPVVWKYTGSKPNIKVTEEIEKRWLEEKLNESDSFRFAITVDDLYVGNIQLTNVVEKQSAEYHIFIGDTNYWGKGIANLATKQIVRFAANILSLKELYLFVNPSNQGAIKVYEKSGFKSINNQIEMHLNLAHCPRPTVSVFMMSYNHAQYIEQAIEGVLLQKTNFDFDINIGDDGSIDSTREIIKSLQARYPGKFNLIFHAHNIGAEANQSAVLAACTGDYVAMCEGDDYWTDPYKLQKQVDFLEANPEYNLTCHRYQTYNETTKTLTEDGNEDCFTDGNEEGLTFDALYIFRRWISKTLTVVFRNDHNYSSLLSQYQYARDVHLFYHILKNGKGFFFPFIGGVYRVHDGGVFSASSQMDKLTKGSLIFREIAEKNPDFQPVYQGHIDNVINKIDGNIFAHRFPFLRKENYILIHHLYSVCNKRKTAIHRFGKLFFALPGKILRKIKSLLK